jgi:hypothetical protein
MRPIATVLGFAAVTAVTTLAVCWPKHTFADPPETFYGAGDVEEVSFTGTVERDTSVKTGWAIKVTFQNSGDSDEPCSLDTELLRGQVNPESRGNPPGTAVWHHIEKVNVPAHESVERTVEVPAYMAAQLTANEKAMQLREKLAEQEGKKSQPNYAVMYKPYTTYTVGFQKASG